MGSATIKTKSGKPLDKIIFSEKKIVKNIEEAIKESAKILYKEIYRAAEQTVGRRTGKYHASWTYATYNFQSKPGGGYDQRHIMTKPKKRDEAKVGTFWPGAHWFEFGTSTGIKKRRIIAKAVEKRKKEDVSRFKYIAWKV